MQSGRLWGTEIAGLEECLGGLVARFQKTNVPLEVEEERSSSPFASILVSLDIISSHRRIMRRHTSARVCPRETKGRRLPPFVSTATMQPSSCFLFVFPPHLRASTRSTCTRFEGLKVRRTEFRVLALRDFRDRAPREFHLYGEYSGVPIRRRRRRLFPARIPRNARTSRSVDIPRERVFSCVSEIRAAAVVKKLGDNSPVWRIKHLRCLGGRRLTAARVPGTSVSTSRDSYVCSCRAERSLDSSQEISGHKFGRAAIESVRGRKIRGRAGMRRVSTRVPRAGDALSGPGRGAIVTNETHLARSTRRTVSSAW